MAFNQIRTCVIEVSNWGFQPKGQTVKDEIQNYIIIRDLGLQDKSIVNQPDRPIKAFAENNNSLTLKIVSDQPIPFLKILFRVPR